MYHVYTHLCALSTACNHRLHLLSALQLHVAVLHLLALHVDKGWLYHNTISGTLLLSHYHELYGFEFVSLNKFCLALLVNFFLAVYLDKQTVGYTNGRFHTIRSQIAIFWATYTYVHTYIHTQTAATKHITLLCMHMLKACTGIMQYARSIYMPMPRWSWTTHKPRPFP